MHIHTSRFLIGLGVGAICLALLGAVSSRHPRLPAALATSVQYGVVAESTLAHYGVSGHDGLTARVVDLGQLSPLMGAELFLDAVKVDLPRVSRQAKLVFHTRPPKGEAWHVTFWYKGGGDVDSIGAYDISRTSSALERTVPVMTIQAEEQFTAWAEPAYEQRATEFVVTLQRVGVASDPRHEAGLLYGPETEYHVPLTVTR